MWPKPSYNNLHVGKDTCPCSAKSNKLYHIPTKSQPQAHPQQPSKQTTLRTTKDVQMARRQQKKRQQFASWFPPTRHQYWTLEHQPLSKTKNVFKAARLDVDSWILVTTDPQWLHRRHLLHIQFCTLCAHLQRSPIEHCV